MTLEQIKKRALKFCDNFDAPLPNEVSEDEEEEIARRDFDSKFCFGTKNSSNNSKKVVSNTSNKNKVEIQKQNLLEAKVGEWEDVAPEDSMFKKDSRIKVFDCFGGGSEAEQEENEEEENLFDDRGDYLYVQEEESSEEESSEQEEQEQMTPEQQMQFQNYMMNMQMQQNPYMMQNPMMMYYPQMMQQQSQMPQQNFYNSHGSQMQMSSETKKALNELKKFHKSVWRRPRAAE